MTQEQNNQPNAEQRRLSKLAGVSIFLAPLLFIGCASATAYWLNATWKSGLDGMGQFIVFAIGAQVALFGGSIAAVLSVILALFAQRKIRKQPETLRGLSQARLAIIVSLSSLLGVWIAVGSIVGIYSLREAPRRTAMADIRTAYLAVAGYTREHETFPDTLDEVLSPEEARRYTYLGKGLHSEYIDYQTSGSQSIVVMYSNETINGEYAAVCTNGMTHEWTSLILFGALKESEKIRSNP